MGWRERTKEILAKKNINQVDLAEKLGVTKAAVSIWLNDKRTLSERNTIKLQHQIAEVLGVTPEYLIYGTKDEPRGRSVPHLQSLNEIDRWLSTGTASARTEWSICLKDCSDKTFSLQQVGSAMDASMYGLPTMPSNSMVFIEPKDEPEIDKVCLFKDKAPVLGYYQEFNGQPTLVFFNQSFPYMMVTKENFIGVAIGMAYFF